MFNYLSVHVCIGVYCMPLQIQICLWSFASFCVTHGSAQEASSPSPPLLHALTLTLSFSPSFSSPIPDNITHRHHHHHHHHRRIVSYPLLYTLSATHTHFI